MLIATQKQPFQLEDNIDFLLEKDESGDDSSMGKNSGDKKELIDIQYENNHTSQLPQ